MHADEPVDFRYGERLLKGADDDEVCDVGARVLLACGRCQHALLHVVVHHGTRDDLLAGLVQRSQRVFEKTHQLVHVQVDGGYLVVAREVQGDEMLGIGRCADGCVVHEGAFRARAEETKRA